MSTPAARALLSEMHPCDDRDNAHSTPGGTWHMSSNRMGSMLAAVEQQAIHAAGVRVTGEAGLDVEATPDGSTDPMDIIRWWQREAYAAAARAERLEQALRVAHHKPHDQAGKPVEGFPTCSVCGAIQTEVAGEAGCPSCGAPASGCAACGWKPTMPIAALAPVRVTGDAGLDVERLALALEAAMSGKHVTPIGLRSEFGLPPIWEPLAEDIAREYAALNRETPA